MADTAPPRFLCDVMLGKLARELRSLGLDVKYDRLRGGMGAYRQAQADGRTFLTRSSRLKSLPGAVFIESEKPAEQVEQVKRQFAVKPEEKPGNRCTVCNEPLEAISREQARPAVPFFIYQIHHDFHRCRKCGRIYWPGSHVENMARRAATPRTGRPARRPFRRQRQPGNQEAKPPDGA
uniref:Mut7-C RNAse domain-containing protein n=1 Tax=candidate division WOR-3 bacterium TaxID=2052148 RepID=A0A7C4GEH7_UNCW3